MSNKGQHIKPRKLWTADEAEQLRARFPNMLSRDLASELGIKYSQLIRKAAALGLKKSAAHLASAAAKRTNGQTGKVSRFKPGNIPFNKGKKMPGQGKSSTWFKPGRPANEARNYLPLGSLRLSKDGLLERKTTDDPSIFPASRWEAEHRLVWTAAHGPIPGNHVVVFRPGRRTTDIAQITPDALELITRQQLMSRNSIHSRYPPELAKIVQLRGALNRQINRKSKEIENARST